MEVKAWLRELGLERYAQDFANNDVDEHTLPNLTEGDLVEIGVKSVGHRRRLSEAIAALRLAGPSPQPTAAIAPVAQTGGAERRMLSVLYCDMGSPATHALETHAEDLREGMHAFHRACTDIVAEFGGHVANFYGDRLLAYFGWPRAHEDDGERAVNAGLRMVRLVGRPVAAGEVASVRVGIASGEVVVGDLIHEGPARDQSAVGLTPNLGARMLSLAAAGQVVIDELTQRLLPPSFTVHPLGRHAVKGVAEPLAAYAVEAERLSDSRFDARKGQNLAPMVGRDLELALLMDHWAQAQAGEGRAVLLVGDAGMGKSRLVRAMLDACAGQPHWAVRWQCSSYHGGSALWPVIQHLNRAAGLGEQDSTDQALDKLEATVGSADASALYATLLGLNGAQRYGPMEMTPQMLRERTMELMVEQLNELAEQRPVLLVVEDAHWIDPTTDELIERCLERIASTRVLILITTRSDDPSKLPAHSGVMRMSLSRLSRASVQAIVTRLGGDVLRAQTLATIAAQADGVPLFVEELTKAVLETGEAAIPASLQGSLMARLDKAPDVKEVAQIAACIGREFDQALLGALAEQPEMVATAVDKLVAAELLFGCGVGANPKYMFRHALVQEAAYQSLLRSKRQHIHGRLLEVLDAQRKDTPPEILAHHAERANRIDRAVDCWGEAGNAALAKSAYVEAVGYLSHATELIQARVYGADRKEQELELQLRLGQALIAAQGFSAAATGRAFMRANELLEADASATRYGLRARYGLFDWHASRGELRQALQVATRALAVAHSDGAPEGLLGANRMMGTCRLLMGDFTAAQDHYRQAFDLLDFVNRDAITAVGASDPAAAIPCFQAFLLRLQGYAARSEEVLARLHGVSSTTRHVAANAHIHFVCALRAACARDYPAVLAEAEALVALASKHRLSLYKGFADIYLSWVAVQRSAPREEPLEQFGRSLANMVADNTRVFIPFFDAQLAIGLAAGGRREEALRTIEQAVAECEDTAQGWCHAEVMRVQGELLLHDPAVAIRCFEQAMVTARAQGAKLWELRAAVSLARLWRDQGKHAESLNLLAPVYAWFTEGFESADLVDARALLTELVS